MAVLNQNQFSKVSGGSEALLKNTGYLFAPLGM